MTTNLPAGVPNQMLIGGKWVDSDAGTFDVLDPATGQVLTSVPDGRAADMRAAVDAAAAALSSNAVSFARLPIDDLLAPNGYLAKLRSRGYAIESPDDVVPDSATEP